MVSSIRDSLFIALQRALPARLIARGVRAATRSQNPILKNLLIGKFVRHFGVDVAEAERPVPEGYDSFNAFFTRALKAGARPIDPDPASIVSPADGTIQQIGAMRGDELLQAKGITYSAAELFGCESTAARFHNGAFVTVYLAPRNYHRVHMPLAGRVRRMTHVPGELWSVNATTAARVPRLFARNERLICYCDAGWGPFAVILVGALNVGSISTVWAGEVLPRRERNSSHWDYEEKDPRTELARGATLGQFNMGSTVIVLLPPAVAVWRPDLRAGDSVRTGMALGSIRRATIAP